MKDGLEARILATAAKLFAQKGFYATGMRTIARRAKVSIGAIYHHFKGKEEILEGILRKEIERRGLFLEELRAQGLPLQEQVRQIFRMHFALLKEERDAARLFFRERFDPNPTLRKKIQELYDEVAEYVAQLIREGITAGEIAPCQPILTAYAVLGMVESVSFRALDRDETAALLMEEGPKELGESAWLWLRGGQKKEDENA